ncbi:hypothetical protein [Ruegeria meonggei]|uniref:hypothetical protein n=1 Tax=Ruegeria meonggei TaxID=1446476 RepID=UPI001179F665|nr:hypothetical protein [Ruegeria meonggei]
MTIKKVLAAGLAALIITPQIAVSETYKESFECKFGPGLVNRPTPTRVVFSVDEFGRSALLHRVDIPKIDTGVGPARIKRDTPKVLSIAWVGQNYVYSASGRTYATNESRYDAIDLLDLEFSVMLNRSTLKATAKSATSIAYAPRDGFAKGACKPITTPNS